MEIQGFRRTSAMYKIENELLIYCQYIFQDHFLTRSDAENTNVTRIPLKQVVGFLPSISSFGLTLEIHAARVYP